MPNFRRDSKTVFSLVFFALLIFELAPIWYFPYFPSADGPSHLFNSYVFLNYSHTPIFQAAFTPQIPPAGNLTGHGLVIVLMRLGVLPETCEKLVVSLCIVALALAFRYAATSIKGVHPAASLFVFPFLYNWPMQMGFWSFSLGVPFILVAVGLCLRYHGAWNLRSLSWLFVTAAAVYACHPLSWAVCGLMVALMSIASEGPALLTASNRSRAWRQTLLPILIFIPFAIPNLIFARQNDALSFDHLTSLREMLWPVYTTEPVHIFAADSRAARALFLFLVLASLANLAWRRRTKITYPDTLLSLAVLLFLLGLFSPGRIGEGSFIEVRFLLFGFLVLSHWLAITLPRPLIQIASTLAVLLSIWLTLARLPAWKKANIELSSIARLGNRLVPDSFVCQLVYRPDSENVEPLDHAIDLWTARHAVDVLDYEAARKAFWTRFRPGYYLDESYLKPASHTDFEAALARFEQRTGKKLDYILITDNKLAPKTALERVLPTQSHEYRLIATGPPNIALFELTSLLKGRQ
ncbi:MAG TPA: hypothetical protein VHZ55_07515 [Bryobacteraceae bacterium]|nr:hypothetical protein [Bryobacteraceae bacterium]